MFPLGAVLLGAVMVAYGWYLAGLAESKTTGLIAGTAAIGLVGGALWGSPGVELSTLFLLWGIFAALVAVVGLWEFETRALGFYALFLTIASLFYLILFLGASVAGLLVSLIAAVCFVLLFFQLTPPFPALQRINGYLFLVSGALVALVGFGMLLKFLA